MNDHNACLARLEHIVSRRTFAKLAGLAGAAVALAPRPAAAQAAELTDVDIMNFALNLEYAEAEFYTMATSGMTIGQMGIPIDGAGTAGPSQGLVKLDLPRPLQGIAEELAADERQHVLLLRSAMQSTAVAKPALDFSVTGVTDMMSFLAIARILEDVGVSAYGGALPFVIDHAVLGMVSRIALTEAYHAGHLRLQAAEAGVTASPFDSLDIVTKYFPTDPQGRAQIRTASQVLALVYLNPTPGTAAGGIFPAGVNGAITAV